MLLRARQRVSNFAAEWAAPIGLALATAAAVWSVWYCIRPVGTATAVEVVNGLCNPSILARYIMVEVLLQSGGTALATGVLKGGYDK